MLTTPTMPDNLAIAYLAQMASPHMTDRQLSKAVRIMDKRDTLGHKRSDRVKRSAMTPAILDSIETDDHCDQVDHSSLIAAVRDDLASAGMADLIPHLLAGSTVRQAALACGVSERTARHHVARIRENLAGLLADQ